MTDNFNEGRYEPETKEAILDAMVESAESQAAFATDLDPAELSIIRAHYDPIAEEIAHLQEDLQITLNSVQIDHATGLALDLLGASKGVSRNAAVEAEGRIRFSRNQRATQDYTIAAGTIVQTDETQPVKFETDNTVQLAVLDNFEDNDISNYDGDTADFSVVTSTVHEGTYALELAAAADSMVWTDETTFGSGSEFYTRLNIGSTSEAAVLFGVEDASNFYEARVDNNNGNIEIGKVESGTYSSIDSSSAAIPDGEWLDVRIDWKTDGDITLDVDDANNADVAELTVNDTTYDGDGLGFGFKTLDANAAKYVDTVQMSSVGAAITAVNAGPDGNLGANVLTVLPETINGVESVTNTAGTSGGVAKEEDDDYRERVKSELGDGVRGTQAALISRLEGITGVTSVTVIENDGSSSDAAGRPPHSFECVVETDSDWYDEVAQTIVDTKGTGYEPVGGYAGTSHTITADLPNYQTKDITFSTPTVKTLFADIDLTKTSTYAGDDQVRDNIVQYVGGTLASGDSADGELEAGDNVIYYQVAEAIMDVEGVHDITNLEIAFSSSPTGTSNLAVANTEQAVADASGTDLDVTSSDA